jgi:hypothetical protein
MSETYTVRQLLDALEAAIKNELVLEDSPVYLFQPGKADVPLTDYELDDYFHGGVILGKSK